MIQGNFKRAQLVEFREHSEWKEKSQDANIASQSDGE